jgi:reactive chlorine resistance protein C
MMMAHRLERAGTAILRYGLVLILVAFGAQKWTRAESEGIQAWVAHSPFLSWLYTVSSLQGASEIIGAMELAIAVLIVVRPRYPLAAAWGSLGGAAMFVVTLSFLVTTPGGSQGFLIKEMFLLGAALWSAGEAFAAAHASKGNTR